MNYEEAEKLSLTLTDNLCNQILKRIKHFVIGGWATTAYCGNIRFTADVDIMTMPLTTLPVLKAFDKDWSTRKVFYGVQAKHKKTGIEVHINTISNMPDRSTNTKISIPNELFEHERRLSIRGLYYKKEIEIPVCPFNYLLTLKAIPNRLKDDFDFCLLLLNKNYSADEFVHYLKECADTKPFLNKCKRITNREYFFSLPKSVITNYTFDLVKFKAVFKSIEEVKSLL